MKHGQRAGLDESPVTPKKRAYNEANKNHELGRVDSLSVFPLLADGTTCSGRTV